MFSLRSKGSILLFFKMKIKVHEMRCAQRKKKKMKKKKKKMKEKEMTTKVKTPMTRRVQEKTTDPSPEK